MMGYNFGCKRRARKGVIPIMPLTHTTVRNVKPADKSITLFDGGGLFLLVSPTGGKWWRLKYRYEGKGKLLSLGTYPAVPLKQSLTWAEGHSSKIIRRLEMDVFPYLGKRPIGRIMAPELLTVLRRIESRGAIDTAHRAHQNCGQ